MKYNLNQRSIKSVKYAMNTIKELALALEAQDKRLASLRKCYTNLRLVGIELENLSKGESK